MRFVLLLKPSLLGIIPLTPFLTGLVIVSGKTLVAEILLLRRVIQQKRKAIVVVPFVSLAREKTLYLQVRPARP